ncbi:MAG TPA: metallophosphoesterase [Stellaceae bacterium]|nr:metallophosphoesterase [Stellaceae bacterium]
MFRVIQISDTHLGAKTNHFRDNWRIAADWIAAERPDLVINTGDISLDGADFPDDFIFAAGLHAELGCDVLAVPGNHDVGDHPKLSSGRQVINPTRRQCYLDHIGPDRWTRIVGNWLLIGIDALLIGSGLPEEAEQTAWLRDAVAGAGERRIAVFLHKPFFLETRDEAAFHYWCVEPTVRADYAWLLDDPRLRLVSSGHLHQYRLERIGHTQFLWAPSVAFICGPALQEDLGGLREVGVLDLRFGDDDVTIERLRLPGMTDLVFDEIVHELYPPLPERV